MAKKHKPRRVYTVYTGNHPQSASFLMLKFPFTTLGRSSTYALWYFALVIALPIVTLLIAGFIFFWQNNLLIVIVAVWLVISAICYGVFIYWPTIKAEKQDAKSSSEDARLHDNKLLPGQLEARPDWSDQDKVIWERSCLAIEAQLQQKPDWQAMPDLALEQLALISEEYHGASKSAVLHFTVPELLLVISVASSRYRQMVIQHVPYIDKISIARANTLLKQKDKIRTSYNWLNRARRTVRLINPVSALVSELRDVISNTVLTKANDALQTDLKRILLQEITQVGIDLYSGKLVTSELELASYQSQTSINDEQSKFDAAEPLRVVLIGQSSVGKSSLINALTKEFQAEVGVLPVTDRLTVHQLQLADATIVHLVDTPGIDGTDDIKNLLLEQALQADLIIWLAKATQPARGPDQELYAALQHSWSLENARLQPPLIMALTHIDQLSPKSVWEPPYDLSTNNPKAESIVAASESAKTRINFPKDTLSIPLYLGESYDQYNTDSLAAQIIMLADTSINVQRNRRRIELSSNSPSWSARWTQAKNLSRVIGRTIVRKR